MIDLRLLRRFTRLPRERRLLLFEATCWLALARASLLLFPFRRVAGNLGVVTRPGAVSRNRSAGLSLQAQAQVAEIGWAVARAARYLPFRAVCLPQAIAAKAMLRRRDLMSVLHFGVAKDIANQNLEAHAWLDAAGIEVTGFPVPHRFTEIACYE